MEKIADQIKQESVQKSFELKSNNVEARFDGLHSENEHVSSLSKWMQNFSFQLNSNERQLNLALKEIQGYNGKVREELYSVRKEREECSKELAMKKLQLGAIEKSIEQQNEEFKSNEEKLALARMNLKKCCKSLFLKSEELESVEESLQVHCKEFEVKEKELESLNSLLTSCDLENGLKQKELIMKTHQLCKVESLIDDKKKQQDSINDAIKKCSEELKMKQKEVKSIDECISLRSSKVRLKKRIKQLNRKLRSKKEDFYSLKETMRTYCQDLELKVREFNAIRETIKDRNEELALEEDLLKSVQMSITERSKQLKAVKEQLSIGSSIIECSEQFELKKNNIDPVKISFEECSNEPESKKTCSSLLTDEMCNLDLVPNEVIADLVLAPNPAMFVLGVIQKNGGLGLDASVKSKILLMEKLIEVSPKISPGVKAEAAKLALSWEANLSSGSDKLTEVWAFLLYLAAFRLVHYYGDEHILKLVLAVASQRNAPNICRLLNFTHKIPEIIKRLIARNQHKDAARFSIAFRLLDKFPLEFILEHCFENIKGKAIDEELSVLKAISDYNVVSGYDMKSTLCRIIELENQKALCSRASSLVTPAYFNTQQQLHNQNKRARTGTSYIY